MSKLHPLAYVFFCLTVLLAVGCEPKKATKSEAAAAPVEESNSHTSQNALDWHGTYEGVLPCADCEGMQTTLTLRPDHTYRLEVVYLGKESEPFTYEGNFAWTSDGGTAYLNDVTDRPNRFFIGEGFVAQLDLEGKRITGSLGKKYELKKVETSPLAGSSWRLTELLGRPFNPGEEPSAVPTLSFSAVGTEVSGQAGCNSFSGPVSWGNPNRLSFGDIVSTLRACPHLEKEKQYFEALEKTDSYHLEGDTLQLFRARMAPLAKFVRDTERN